MTTDAQSHSGAVGGGTPAVSYAFAAGSGGNPARRTSLTYPDGRVVAFGYGSAGTLDERLYATMDYFNATAAPDADGDVVERYAYSAFGARRVMAPDFTPRSASAVDWVFAFQGQFLDPETGYYDYGYRFSVPLLGRWFSRDPITESGGGNLYEFAKNSAINSIDTQGLFASSFEASHDAGVNAIKSEHALAKASYEARQRAFAEKNWRGEAPELYVPKEHCGKICCTGSSEPSYYTTKTMGDPKVCLPTNARDCEKSDKMVGWWHTHPGYISPKGELIPGGRNFSGEDGDEGWVRNAYPEPLASNRNPNNLPLTMTRATDRGGDNFETKALVFISLKELKVVPYNPGS